MSSKRNGYGGAQSSLELLITLAFGLTILVPIIVLAFLQISSSSSSLSAGIAQASASKLAAAATAVGTQGYLARLSVIVQVPPNVQNIFVGTQANGLGHEIIFVLRTSAGASYVTAYTPANVSGYLEQISQPGTYLLNITAQRSCQSVPGTPCVYVSAPMLAATTTVITTSTSTT